MIILYSLGIMLVLGLVFGVLFSVIVIVCAVSEEASVIRISDILPFYNCGRCGFAGCAEYARSLANKKTTRDLCLPGGKETSEKIGLVLGPSDGK